MKIKLYIIKKAVKVMEQWNGEEFEATIRKSNKTRSISLYRVLQQAYIDRYSNSYVIDKIGSTGDYCSFAPILEDSDKNMSLSAQAERIEQSGRTQKFDAFKRTSQRQLSTIFNAMLDRKDSLQIFLKDGDYQFSTAQSAIIRSLLELWVTDTENAKNFSRKQYDKVESSFLLNLQNAVRYLLTGCLDDKIDLVELQKKWDKKFKASFQPELEREWETAKKRLQHSLKDLRETLNLCILDEIAPREIKSIETGQAVVWPIEDQIQYMNDCEERISILVDEFWENSLRGQNELYKDFAQLVASEEKFRKKLAEAKMKREQEAKEREKESEDKKKKFYY